MKNKKKIILISVLAMSTGVLAFAIVPASKTFSMKADEGYTCPLPGSFVELDDVIQTAVSAGTTETDNTYQFRATVTRRVGDVAYVQRVNQEDHYLYGLRVEGCSTYANSLQAGNVVNFSGGKVYIYQGGIPTFKLTASTNATVAYATNPTGYGPVTYHTLGDAIDENTILDSWYYNGNTYQSYYYGANRLSKICELVPSAAYTFPNDNESRYLFKFTDASGDRNIYVAARQDSGFYTTFTNALNDGKNMNITGYYQLYHDSSFTSPYFNMVDVNDAEIVEPLDDDTITSTRTATFYVSDTYYKNFAIYNVKNHGDVPYVEVINFYNNAVFLKQTNHNTYKVTQYDSTSHQKIYRNSLFDFTVNSSTDVIAINSDPNHMAFEERPMQSGLELIATGSETKYCKVDTANSHVYGSGQNYSFDLSKYGLDIVEDNSHKMYVPLQAMNLIFNDSIGYATRYNGKDLYYSSFSTSSSSNFFSECAFSSTISNEYAEYNYATLCLALEDIYGLCGVRGVQSEGADALISRLGYKNALKSTNLDTYERNFMEFAGKWFFEGHSGAMLTTSGYVDANYLCPANKSSSTDWHNYYLTGLYNNARFDQMYGTAASNIKSYRNSSGKGVGVTFYDDTAIIIFDEFVKADDIDSAEYAEELLDDPDLSYADWAEFDTPLFFRKAFNDIDSHGGIHNVVIDLTNNGGGRNDALVFLEAYMTSDPVHTSMNRLTGMTYDVHYDVDINYDGVIDSNDTYQGVYDFYLMTSQLSFSCGNYLPTTAYVNGYATLIGQQSGGGTCCVGYLTTAVGDMLRSSSNHFLGYWQNDSFHNNESGIPVQATIASQYFYNDQYIDNFIANLH